MATLAEQLELGLHSPGVCPACLSLVAIELEKGDERKVAARSTQVAPFLWDEGLGDMVRAALEGATRRGSAAAAALCELDASGAGSSIFRAVVRRLAGELAAEVRRAEVASLN